MMKRIRKTHKQGREEEEEHDKDYFDGSHHADGSSDFLENRKLQERGVIRRTNRQEMYHPQKACKDGRYGSKKRKHGGKKLQRTRDSIDITPTAPPTSGRTRSFREQGSH